jgi:hypothetical protein
VRALGLHSGYLFSPVYSSSVFARSWLLSVDQYFQGEVAYILDTVLDRLVENPDRKFMFVETGFFERWFGLAGKHRHKKTKPPTTTTK